MNVTLNLIQGLRFKGIPDQVRDDIVLSLNYTITSLKGYEHAYLCKGIQIPYCILNLWFYAKVKDTSHFHYRGRLKKSWMFHNLSHCLQLQS